ncbi:probable proteasome inhibitor [Mangifera indica]|uniref:probable proteasome inhibitor n=1 Tax=Mangifera indica TaxID=29780 RepID=UPI001CFC1736|nr:probable proteasome inhibitor [Mangifera indica]XP_044481980.1 probable proteasome inhibitor [Mangifera indica]
MADGKSVLAVIRAARPTFRNNHDKLAFLVHASFLASGHVLTATGPSADDSFTSPSTDEVGIDHWNELEDNYVFVYINPEKGSKKVLVKCLVMGNKLVVDALAQGASEPVHLEIDVGQYIGEGSTSNYSTQFKNLDKLVKSLDTEILSKLNVSPKPSSLETGERSRRNINDCGVGIYEPTGPQPHPSGVVLPPVDPGGISDLFPGSGAGMYPRRDPGTGGSMLIGPNDPRWFGGGIGGQPGFLGGQPGVPPGARFDPYGPPGVPGFEPNRFARNPPRRGGGNHPDLEHFPGGSDFI